MNIDFRSIVYTAFFVDSPQVLLEQFPPKHKNVFAHHSTNIFRPKSPTDIENLEIGKKVMLKITGRVSDEKGDALLVENPKSENKYPHITLSCADGVPPFYSVELIEKATAAGTVEYFAENSTPLFVPTTEGYYGKDGVEYRG